MQLPHIGVVQLQNHQRPLYEDRFVIEQSRICILRNVLLVAPTPLLYDHVSQVHRDPGLGGTISFYSLYPS